jgi:hypothetical protein
VAFKDPIPVGCSPKALQDSLSEIYDLVEMEKHRGAQWCGVEAIKSSIRTYVTEATKWEANKRQRGAVRFPSMHTFDGRGRAFRGGVGSDSGEVKTYFDAQGARHNFAVDYHDGSPEWVPEWIATPKDGVATGKPTDQQIGGIIDNPEKARVECPVCGHTESYNLDSATSRSAARGRMSKHFKTAKKDVDAHREASVKEFGGTSVQQG